MRSRHVVLAGGLAAGRRDRADQGQWRQADRLRARAGAGQEADALGRRRAGDRGDGGRRPYRPGLDQRAGAGNPAPRRGRHPGVRRRRHRPRRGDRRLSRNGRGRRAARHPLRLRPRMHRPSQFQEGLPPRLGARRDPLGPDRPAPAGHPGARAQEPRDGEFRRQAARGRAEARRRRDRDGRGPAADRALLGGRAPPRGDRRRCRERHRSWPASRSAWSSARSRSPRSSTSWSRKPRHALGSRG